MADYIAKGPTADEVQRAVMSEVSGRIRGLEQVGGFGGKAVTLAEGQTYAARQRFLQEDAGHYAAITPAAVRAAMQQWLHRPALTIMLSPGERATYAEAKAPPRRAERAPRTPARPSRRARCRRSASLPRSTSRRSSTPARERHPGRLCPAQRRPGDPDGAGVQRRQRVRQRRRRAAFPSMTMDLLDEGTAD